MHPDVGVADRPAATLACDALVVGAFSRNGRGHPAGRAVDELVDESVADYVASSGFKGKVGEIAIVPTFGRLPARSVTLVGLGPEKEFTSAVLRRAAGAAARALSERSVVASMLHTVDDSPASVRASVEGFMLGGYRFTQYKSGSSGSALKKVLFVDATDESVGEARIAAEATALARDLTNEPASALTPETFAERAQEIATAKGLECSVLDENELASKGFGGILGVSAGSARPPRLITLRYVPDKATDVVALVGKGVTFDSGGLSLKDAKNMETMKTDKAGAASVLAAMSALPDLNLATEVIALIPAVENMPGSNAIKPGDVITHYGKSTTEVLNTDAEGRLILADALVYASEQKPSAIVDVATLTGSILVALGRKLTGLFCNDETLTDELQRAADAAGEPLWAMPLYDDYKSELESETADVKNIGSRYGGSITAALFLARFVGDGIPWAHLDIAGAARAESDYDDMTKGGTGVPTRTLLEWVGARAR